MPYCNQCGANNAAGQNYCSACGANVRADGTIIRSYSTMEPGTPRRAVLLGLGGLIAAVAGAGGAWFGERWAVGASHSADPLTSPLGILVPASPTPTATVTFPTPTPGLGLAHLAPFLPPPVSVTTYIQGMVQFDAGMMWQSLDQSAVAAMINQNGSEQALQKKLDQARSQGASYDDVAYVGGTHLLDGSQYSFYVVTRTGFSSPNTRDQEFFVFTVGASGKISAIQ